MRTANESEIERERSGEEGGSKRGEDRGLDGESGFGEYGSVTEMIVSLWVTWCLQ